MNKNDNAFLQQDALNNTIKQFALIGAIGAFIIVVFASLMSGYIQYDELSLSAMLKAQMNNPALWLLDITPILLGFWGQEFCYRLTTIAMELIQTKTKQLENKSGDLESELKFRAMHDNLTNLPNNQLFMERLNQALTQLAPGENVCVIVLTINHFRELNVNIGSINGNKVLVAFAEKLKSLLIEPYLLQPQMGMNIVGRLQAAQFAILLPRLKEEHNLKHILANIVQATQLNLNIDGKPINISTTAGSAVYPLLSPNGSSLVDDAILSMQHAQKEQLSNAIYDPSMQASVNAHLAMVNEVKNAIETKNFDLNYLPTVSMRDQAVLGAEILIRFLPEDLGLIPNPQLGTLIEGTEFARQLFFSSFEQALTKLSNWKMNDKACFIHVDLSLLNIADPSLASHIEQLLEAYAIPASLLKFEISEATCLSNQSASLELLKHLTELGAKIVIRDFASSNSSISYLAHFPIHEIQLSEHWIQDLKNDATLRLIKGIIKLCDAMNISILAQGIHDESSFETLLALGCKLGQGRYFSEPLNASHFMGLLINQPFKTRANTPDASDNKGMV